MALIWVEAFYSIVVGAGLGLKAEMNAIEHLGSRASMVIATAEKGVVLLFLAWAGVYLINLTSWNDSGTGNLLTVNAKMVWTLLRIFLHDYSLL